jgi:cytochrome c oxidase accessory protein FixG
MKKSAPVNPETFRDQLSAVSSTGQRVWMYPRAVSGFFFQKRRLVAWVLLGLWIVLPWLEYQGYPLFLLNGFERQFIFFGVPFFPQDFHLVALGLLTFMVFVMGFTVIFGRVWCGWACPQTVFMEMIFRPLEALIEGNHNERRRLDAQPLAQKWVKKATKHGLFLLISSGVAHLVMAYIVGKKALFEIVTHSPSQHWVGFGALLIFTGIFYAVFAHLRELACVVICPYGRLQGALLDNNSMVIAYDFERGEPRGKLQSTTSLGHCIDCRLCVQVCPTGIDIRNGIQMECIGCTSCIDACDEVMDKIQAPRGLVRYASIEGIRQQKPFRFTPRLLAYSTVLLSLLGLLVFLLLTRNDLEVTVLRAPGQLFQRNNQGQISNLYNVQLLNKSYATKKIQLRVKDKLGLVQWVGASWPVIEPGQVTHATFFVAIPQDSLHAPSTAIVLEVWENNERVEEVKTRFLGQ